MSTRDTRRPGRPSKPSSARGAGAGTARKFAARIAALEERVARLETGKPPPGDGRAAVSRRKTARRCPGCGLPLRARQGRCTGCGRPLD